MIQQPELRTINDVVKKGLCVSCGACLIAGDPHDIVWDYSKRFFMPVPKIVPTCGIDYGNAFAICPGKGVEIIRLARSLISPKAQYDLELGYILAAFAVKSTNDRLLKSSSSGGIVTSIAYNLLSTGSVTGVIATRFIYGPQGPKPEAFIARTLDDLIECQGSKYCPVSIHEPLLSLKGKNEKIAFIGTPCQIAGIRMLMERFDWLRTSIHYVIGSFCGGIKDFRNLNTIISRQGIKPAEVTSFCFRGGGQPGRMLITDSHNRVKTRPYPDYGTDTGFKKLERCRLCIDATSELADISCGDAWIPRFLESGSPWSIALARNENGSELLQNMVANGMIEIQNITIDEIKRSQRSNLSSKKKRQAARRQLYKLFGRKLPAFDGGFSTKRTSLLVEVQVYFSHFAFFCLETLRLYVIFIKFARWIRGTNEFKKAGTVTKL